MSESLVVVGAGRMGLALGAALHAREAVGPLIYHGRSLEPPPHPLFDPVDPAQPESAPAEYRVMPLPVAPGSTALILAVPDDQVADVAYEISTLGPAPSGCVALHLSGALSTDPLDPLHAAGYATGSLHPLQTIAHPSQGVERLIGCAYGVTGEPAAVLTARRIVAALDGIVLIIPPGFRPLYHAAAVAASNYLVTLAAWSERQLMHAGVDGAEALQALLPLMRGTLDNLEALGTPSALTGPIARGDAETVRLHLARLSGPARALYCALGLETLGLAREAGLDERHAAALESLLSSG